MIAIAQEVRAQLLAASAASVIAAAQRSLWAPYASDLEFLRSAPWITLLLVKWGLQGRATGFRVAPHMSQIEFDTLRQRLWDCQGELRNPANPHAMLRALIHTQTLFQ